jgi:hypothetical protein
MTFKVKEQGAAGALAWFLRKRLGLEVELVHRPRLRHYEVTLRKGEHPYWREICEAFMAGYSRSR